MQEIPPVVVTLFLWLASMGVGAVSAYAAFRVMVERRFGERPTTDAVNKQLADFSATIEHSIETGQNELGLQMTRMEDRIAKQIQEAMARIGDHGQRLKLLEIDMGIQKELMDRSLLDVEKLKDRGISLHSVSQPERPS